jgi:hypothetical protein
MHSHRSYCAIDSCERHSASRWMCPSAGIVLVDWQRLTGFVGLESTTGHGVIEQRRRSMTTTRQCNANVVDRSVSCATERAAVTCATSTRRCPMSCAIVSTGIVLVRPSNVNDLNERHTDTSLPSTNARQSKMPIDGVLNKHNKRKCGSPDDDDDKHNDSQLTDLLDWRYLNSKSIERFRTGADAVLDEFVLHVVDRHVSVR